MSTDTVLYKFIIEKWVKIKIASNYNKTWYFLRCLSYFKYLILSQSSSVSLFTTRHSVTETHPAHLGDSRGHTVFDTLVYGVRLHLAAPLLHEGQESLFKHGRGAEHHHSQGVIWVGQVKVCRQQRVIPSNLWTRCHSQSEREAGRHRGERRRWVSSEWKSDKHVTFKLFECIH